MLTPSTNHSPPEPHSAPTPLVVWTAVALVIAAPLAAGEVTRPEGAASSVRPEPTRGWTHGDEHRFVWIQKKQKVGETRFRLTELPHPARPGEKILEIRSARTYSNDGITRRATGVTLVTTTGSPLRFEETLFLVPAATPDRGTKQTTKFERDGRKVRVTYRPNDVERSTIVRERELDESVYLCGNQALEHWVVFTAQLPREFASRTVQLYYPDQRRVFDVHLRANGSEKLKIGDRAIVARRYAFRTTENAMSGNIWLDAGSRLVQVEFPRSALRVVLTPEAPEPKSKTTPGSNAPPKSKANGNAPGKN